MKRWFFFIYGVFAYLSFLAVYGWFAGFVGNVFVPKSIDSAPAEWPYAVVVDSMLIGLFGVQHSIMARPWFKQIWTRVIPKAIERSTYVVISNVLVVVLMWQWRAFGAVIWDVQNPAGRVVLWSLFTAGWLMVPLVSMMISHFDLFGIRQVWLFLRGKPYTSLPFRTPMLYSKMRHPLYVGWAIAFWATPTMTVGHLFFAATLTIYMVMAARVEERDLVRFYGDAYRSYQGRVRMFFPRLSGDKGSQKAAAPVAEAVWRVPQLP